MHLQCFMTTHYANVRGHEHVCMQLPLPNLLKTLIYECVAMIRL